MTAMAAQSGGGASLPRRATKSAKLQSEQKLTLAKQYLDGDDDAKQALIRKWGRGRVRRALLEFAKHEHDLEFQALRAREMI